MTPRGDHHHEMPERLPLDDAAAEALLAGGPVPHPDLAPVAALISELRSSPQVPAPPPSPALAAVLAGEPAGAEVPAAAGRHSAGPVVERRRAPGHRRPNFRSRLAARLAAAGLAAKVALGTGMAAASVTGAAAAGVLPGPAQNAVAGVVSAVSPFELPRHATDDGAGREPGEPGSTDSIEGVPGDRPGLDPEAPGSGEQPGSPAAPGTPGGLDERPQPSTGGADPTVVPGEPAPDTPGPETDPTRPADPPADPPAGQPDGQPDGGPSSTPGTSPTTSEAVPPAPGTPAGQPESVPTHDHDSGAPSDGSAAEAPEEASATPPTSSPGQRP